MNSVLVALRIDAPPQQVFDAFVNDIALWWTPDDLFRLTPRGDGVLRFEGGEGGRLVTTLPNGKEFEVGKTTSWAPPKKLSFTWRQATFAEGQVTHVEVVFEAVGEQTRVSVTHSGWDSVPQEHVARHNFPERVFLQRQGEHWRALLASLHGLSRR
ncbi:hypothetical protein U91I_02869 [alpha proteobacterium U9-1i]|nr:hypothetical protein U91I_02869 [alpha proteobacterium U9-1i]